MLHYFISKYIMLMDPADCVDISFDLWLKCHLFHRHNWIALLYLFLLTIDISDEPIDMLEPLLRRKTSMLGKILHDSKILPHFIGETSHEAFLRYQMNSSNLLRLKQRKRFIQRFKKKKKSCNSYNSYHIRLLIYLV